MGHDWDFIGVERQCLTLSVQIQFKSGIVIFSEAMVLISDLIWPFIFAMFIFCISGALKRGRQTLRSYHRTMFSTYHRQFIVNNTNIISLHSNLVVQNFFPLNT